MIIFIINIFFILVLGLCMVSILNINKYNNNSKLIILENLEDINNKRILDPILFNIDMKLKIDDNIIYNYPKKFYENNDELIRLEDFQKNDNINIVNNKNFIEDFKLKNYSDKLYSYFSNYLSFNKNYNCSLVQTNIDIQFNKNNLLLISNLFGDLDILLINPKHKELVDKLEINKDFNEYKKISIITKLKKGDTLYIPTNWYYIILVNKLSFILNISSDTYLTYLYNIYK